MPFDPSILRPASSNRYEKQLERIFKNFGHTQNIQETISKSIDNIKSNNYSFVIYGEPQSGKTEMMIALTAKLLDIGKKIIIILLNDNVQLLNQNLDRFKRSGLDPSPRNFDELLLQVTEIKNCEWIIFSKKNSKDLTKLITIVKDYDDKIIIDDDADYASPNSKINRQEITKINELIQKLLGKNGTYIGVTATPARLDLNNTFINDNDKWVCFGQNNLYCGHNVFFLNKEKSITEKKLVLLPDQDDNKKYLRNCLFNFLINNTYLNIKNTTEENYCMLVHTSGKKEDHITDQKTLEEIFNVLYHQEHKKYNKYYNKIWDFANKKFNDDSIADDIVKFICKNVKRYQIIVINSEHDKDKVKGATVPSALYTIAIGGNIVSRGVTFENFLALFFTRTSKHHIQQDTYISRARMFGYRQKYLDHFELHIPKTLFEEWRRCFIYHELSLRLISDGNPAPIWLEDKRVSSVAKPSIDRENVTLHNGEMSFSPFTYGEKIEIIINKKTSSINKMMSLQELIGERSIPNCLIEFIKIFDNGHDDRIAIHHSGSIKNRASGGRIGRLDLEEKKFPHAHHHIKIFKLDDGSAELHYRYNQPNPKYRKNRDKHD